MAAEHTWGCQIIKAAVVARNGLSEGYVRAHCERQLVYYKRPQLIFMLPEFPRLTNGKIDVSRLP